MSSRSALTLLEVILATTIVAALSLTLIGIVRQASDGWSSARSSAEEFGVAEQAFATLADAVSRATLNDYASFSAESRLRTPPSCRVESDLRFICGPMQAGDQPLDECDPTSGEFSSVRPGHGVFFQATLGNLGSDLELPLLGLDQLLNTCGYFVEVGGDGMSAPSFLDRSRFPEQILPKLMELREPTQNMSVYERRGYDMSSSGFGWFRTSLTTRKSLRVVAPNIAIMLLLPKEHVGPETPVGPTYYYNSAQQSGKELYGSSNRLPRLLELTMVVLDKATVRKLYSQESRDPLELKGAFIDASEHRTELYQNGGTPSGESLEDHLQAKHAGYRIFTTTVALRSSR